MKKLLLVLLFPLVSFGADVQWQFSDFTSSALTVKRVYITPLSAPTSSGNYIVSGDRRTFTNDVDGSLIVSNITAGAYRVELNGAYKTTSFTNVFPSTNGFLNAVSWLSAAPVLPSGLYAYSQSASDLRYWGKAGLQPGTNTTYRTNESVVYIDTTGSSGGVSVAVGTNVTTITNGDLITISADQPALGFTPLTPAQTTNAAAYQADIATNGLGSAAFKSTTFFDLAGVGASEALKATNALGSAAWKDTSFFDLAGVGAAEALKATNTASLAINLAGTFLGLHATADAATAYNGTLTLAQVSNSIPAIITNASSGQLITTAAVSGSTITNTGLTSQNLVGTDSNGKLIAGTPFYGPFTNATIYGDQYRSNATTITAAGEVLSNAVGSVTIASGLIQFTNVASGSWGYLGTNTFYLTNALAGTYTRIIGDSLICSNAITGKMFSNTNGQVQWNQFYADIYPANPTFGMLWLGTPAHTLANCAIWGDGSQYTGVSAPAQLQLGIQGSQKVTLIGNGLNFFTHIIFNADNTYDIGTAISRARVIYADHSTARLMSATNGFFYPQGTNTAPTAANIGGTVGSVTNHLMKNVGGALLDYWSDGTTLWSKQLAP